MAGTINGAGNSVEAIRAQQVRAQEQAEERRQAENAEQAAQDEAVAERRQAAQVEPERQIDPAGTDVIQESQARNEARVAREQIANDERITLTDGGNNRSLIGVQDV